MALDAAVVARHAAELSAVEAGLAAVGYDARLDVPAGGVPSLDVALGPDDAGRDRTLTITIVPLEPDGDTVDASRFVQFLVTLPFSATADEPVRAAGAIDHTAAVSLALSIVNAHTAIGHFGRRPDGELYFRYVLVTPAACTLDVAVLTDVVSMVDFHQDHFGDHLEGVSTGEIDVRVLDDVIRRSSF